MAGPGLGYFIDELVQVRRGTLGSPVTQTYYAHQDDLFSVLALSDANGVVAQRYNYGDYGNRSVLTAGGLELDESDALIPHGYTGRLHHPDSGLIEYRYRWLLPETGSFVQRDPLGYVDGMNTHVYCKVAPWRNLDPTGREAVIIISGVAIAVGTA